MRHVTMLLMSGGLVASLLAGCSNSATAPSAATPPPSTPTPPPSSASPAAATAAVTVGDIFFRSDHNGSSNPAVDTVAVNGTVTWTWATTEAMPHSVLSMGSPSFTSSTIMTGSGSSYSFTFATAGTYQYECAVHGALMTGRIVVVAATAASRSTPPGAMPPSTPPPGY